MSQIVIATGKRKTAVARAYLKYPGRGRILINKKPLELIEPWLIRNTIEEPLLFINDLISFLNNGFVGPVLLTISQFI